MMYPAAGVLIWIVLGAMVGWMAGKLTETDGSKGFMANAGIGMVAAVVAGFATSVLFHGEHSNGGFWAGIVVALVAAGASVAIFRIFFPRHVPTLR